MTTVNLGDKEIQLDDSILRFEEKGINKFLQEFGANYNYYAQHYADAQYLHSKYEDKYDMLYAEKFRTFRKESSSDKMADMKVKSDHEVADALENVRIAKRNSNMLWGYLRAMDRTHDNAMQVCYNVRKEMSALLTEKIL